MKKLILLFFLICGLKSYSAYQYDNFVKLNGTNLSITKDANLSFVFSSMITDWENLVIETTKADGTVENKTITISGKEIALGAFQEGDLIKLYLEKGSDKAQDNLTFWGSGWDTENNSYEWLHFGANHGDWGSEYTTHKFQVAGESIAGQPLPGVLVSLGVGLMLLFLYTKYKKQLLTN